MGKNIAQKIISSHLAAGKMSAGSEIGIRIDHTLIHDATARWPCCSTRPLGGKG